MLSAEELNTLVTERDSLRLHLSTLNHKIKELDNSMQEAMEVWKNIEKQYQIVDRKIAEETKVITVRPRAERQETTKKLTKHEAAMLLAILKDEDDEDLNDEYELDGGSA